MAWDPSKPAGTDAASTIDDSVIANNQALDTWASALTDGIAQAAASVFKAYRAANVVIAKFRAAAGDTFDRFRYDLNGKMEWGSGSAALARAWTGPRMVRVKKSANQETTGVADVAITWDQEDFDTDAMHSTVADTERLVAPVAGKYLAILNLSASATGMSVPLFKIKDGTGALQAQGKEGEGLNAGLSLSVPVSLAAAGYVYATFRAAAGETTTIIATTLANFSLIYIGE